MSTKPPKPPEELSAIDPAALAQVTGGTAESTGLINAVNGLLADVKSITATSQANGLNPQDMMLFMMLMQRQQQSSVQTVAAAPPWWGQGGTWYF